MKQLLFCFLVLIFGSVNAAQGGEGNNTGCNGQGNANSPCAAGQGGAGGNANNATTVTNVNQLRTENVNVNLNAASATGGNQAQFQEQSSSATGGSASSDATATSGSTSGASANNTGNTQSVSISSPAAPSKLTIRNTPDAVGIAAAPSANCRITHGLGVSIPALGVSGSSSTLDEGCDTREDARLLRESGLHDAAVARMCMKPELKKALGPLCFE